MIKFWRALALFLLTANLVLLGWRALEPPESAGAPAPREIPPPPDAPRLKLLSEAPPVEGALACYAIGPLDSPETQRAASARLEPFADGLRLRRTDADVDLGWVVFLEAAGPDEAAEISARLEERGVEDYFVGETNDSGTRIFLGLFEQTANARRRQAELAELGFAAEVEVRRRLVDHFWVDYRIAAGQRDPWRAILREAPAARRISMPCFIDSGTIPYNDELSEEPDPADDPERRLSSVGRAADL